MAVKFIKIANCQVLISPSGSDETYQVGGSRRWSVNNPVRNALSIGKQSNDDGISYKTGTDRAATVNGVLMNLDLTMRNMLVRWHRDSTRFNLSLIDEQDEVQKRFTACVVAAYPDNINIDDDDPQFDVPLEFALAPHNISDMEEI